MNHLRHAATVAGWEFRRYFKWKDQIIGLGLFLLAGLVWWGAASVATAKGRTKTVALDGFVLEAPTEGSLRFVPALDGELARLEALRAGDVHGVLTRRSEGAFELLVVKDPRYRSELEVLLGETLVRERLSTSSLTPGDLERILAPPSLEVRFTDPSKELRGMAEKVASGVFIGIFLIAGFTSMAYLLTGITGEKQLRVTESVVASISPQAWIDGKVLGITAFALAGLGSLLIDGLLLAFAAKFATGFTLPPAAVRPEVLLTLALFTLLGLLLWNSFFAAIAATMNDPNTSTRGPMLLLPALPVVMSLALLRDPDSTLSRVLAVFPLTSAPAMPIRLVLSDPGFFEIAAAVVLLLAAIWLLRRLAGRIFEVAMLLYGKEPTLREMWRWTRERSGTAKT